MKPEDHQPSGSCNFSRLDHVELTCHPTKQPNYIQTLGGDDIGTDPVGTKQAKVFAVNYNVLRIMSGMGGLAYANCIFQEIDTLRNVNCFQCIRFEIV